MKSTCKKQEVLQSYSRMEKKITSATCSVLPAENQNQVKTFLAFKAENEFTLIKDKKVLASESGYDGFHMALLEKNY